MAVLEQVVQMRTLSGAPVQVRTMTVTPQSQALTIRLPFGGLVWNRPVAILVARDGKVERIPIVDVTRQVQLALLALTLAFALTAGIVNRRKESERERKSG